MARKTNRVALTNAITLLSLNGPGKTAIVGGTGTRCVYVGSNSVVSGFTITNGHVRTSGNLTNEESAVESGASRAAQPSIVWWLAIT